tara:strand:- start:158 stop:568 length:411 start_codon:yes stop_codon:yes gene_type:complete
MATVLTITPQAANDLTVTQDNTVISATSNVTTLTISSAIAGAAADAQGITFDNPTNTLVGQSTVQSALNFLGDQLFVQDEAPTANTTNLAEGDLFYDTDDNQLKIYREITTGNYSFVPIMIGNDSTDSDTIDAGSF